MTDKIKNTNRWLLQNLFWIVPLNFLLIIGGIMFGAYQRYQSLHNQEKMKQDIAVQLQNDSEFKKKQDSALYKTNELRELLKK